MKEYMIVDGQKSIPLSSLPREAWTVLSGGYGPANRTTHQMQNDVEKPYNVLGILNRCINVRATTMAAVPWTIYKGEKPFINSEEEEFPSGYEWLDGFSEYLYLVEASMSLLSQAYLYKVPSPRANVSIKKFQWLQPDSMTPVWDADDGLVAFKRRLTEGQEREFNPDEILFIWRRDPLHETSPAIPPALAAAQSAGILINYDEFVSQFFQRGAVKTTILRVERGARPAQRAELKKFWQRMLSGVGNAWTTEVVSNDVEPIVIGEGVSEIDNTLISKNRMEDIATTMGVPHSILFSNAATYSTADVEERNFYTYTIIPEALDIQRQLNEKVFREQGLRFSFEWKRLDVFQASAKDRAEVFKLYVDSRVPPSIAAQMAGLTMPEDIPFEELDRLVEEERKARMAAVFGTGVAGAPKPGDDKEPKDPEKDRHGRDTRKQPEPGKSEEIARLRRWAKNRLPMPNPHEFASDTLTDDEKIDVVKAVMLEDAEGEDIPFP